MKEQYKWLCVLLLLGTGLLARAQPGGWIVRSSDFSYNMTVVGQLRINGTPVPLLNNQLGVFRQDQIRGSVNPVDYKGQPIYFLSCYANTYKGDTLQFRAFIGAQQKVYEGVQPLVFKYDQALGTLSSPYPIDLVLSETPVIYSLPEVEYMENSCNNILDVQSSDNLNAEGNGLTYSIDGGADGGKFSIHAQTGHLSWNNFVPDADAPGDANADNRYEVRVRVTDASNRSDVQAITVVVVAQTPHPPINCPESHKAFTGSDGLGNCTGVDFNTYIAVENLCALSRLSYTLTGATTGSGSGMVPLAQVFEKGNTTVTYTLSGNDGSQCSFAIQVEDNEIPLITCPAPRVLSATDPTLCTVVVTGINPVSHSDNCGGVASIAYALSGATTGSGSGVASGQTFKSGVTTVTYTATDASSLKGSCSFNITVSPCIGGTILWAVDKVTGVKDVSVAISGDQSATLLTPASGKYAVALPPGANFMITPSKALNKMNGVNAQDVFRIQQHLNGTIPITDPYLLAASDVNLNNTLTSLDANIIQLSILGNVQALAQFVKSWRFVPKNHLMANPPWGFPEKITLSGAVGNQSGQDFYGIKMGDVASIFANPANSGPEPLLLRGADVALEAGQNCVLELSASAREDLAACQFALRFDPSRLRLLRVEPLSGLPLGLDNFGMAEAAGGILRFMWAGWESVDLKKQIPLFRLHFQTLQPGGRLSEALQVDEERMPARVYTSAQTEAGVSLLLEDGATTAAWDPAAVQSGVSLQQNRPNPFHAQTRIGFRLPEACTARLRVLDMAGRVLVERSGEYLAGFHEATLELENTPGLLYCELTTPWGVWLRKMEQL